MVFLELQKLMENWQVICEEVLWFQYYIKVVQVNNDVGFNIFFKCGWKWFYFKWYFDVYLLVEMLCLIMIKLVNNIFFIKVVMFVELFFGVYLGKYCDFYVGLVCYYFGLSILNDDCCFIEVD